jgi:hypothetical protein
MASFAELQSRFQQIEFSGRGSEDSLDQGPIMGRESPSSKRSDGSGSGSKGESSGSRTALV